MGKYLWTLKRANKNFESDKEERKKSKLSIIEKAFSKSKKSNKRSDGGSRKGMMGKVKKSGRNGKKIEKEVRINSYRKEMCK